MYLINWTDTRTGEAKSLKVHTLKAAGIVTTSLRDNPYRYVDVRMQQVRKARLRELVIIFEK